MSSDDALHCRMTLSSVAAACRKAGRWSGCPAVRTRGRRHGRGCRGRPVERGVERNDSHRDALTAFEIGRRVRRTRYAGPPGIDVDVVESDAGRRPRRDSRRARPSSASPLRRVRATEPTGLDDRSCAGVRNPLPFRRARARQGGQPRRRRRPCAFWRLAQPPRRRPDRVVDLDPRSGYPPRPARSTWRNDAEQFPPASDAGRGGTALPDRVV